MTPDQRVATKLNVHPDEIRCARDDWNGSKNAVLMRAVIEDRLQLQIDERRNKLETTSPEELKTVQGEIKALKLALKLSTQHPITNE